MDLNPHVTEDMKVAILTKHPASPLSANDRCDSCGGQAYGQAVVNGVPLLFCGHHLNKHLDRLMTVADTIDDYTDALNEGMTSASV